MKTKDMIDVVNMMDIITNVSIPTILSILMTWSSDEEITPEMIDQLRNRIKPASELFNDEEVAEPVVPIA